MKNVFSPSKAHHLCTFGHLQPEILLCVPWHIPGHVTRASMLERVNLDECSCLFKFHQHPSLRGHVLPLFVPVRHIASARAVARKDPFAGVPLCEHWGVVNLSR